MRLYKRMTIISALIALVSFLISILLHYFFICDNEIDFWINLCLGLFSGAILTVFTSIISYYHERRTTLEKFVYHTRSLLSYLNKYHEDMPIEEKIHFYFGYCDLDKSDWDMDIGNMDFFFEKVTGNFKYIYNEIYKPILDFDKAVANYKYDFHNYLNTTNKNDFRIIIEKYLSELQGYLLKKTEKDIPTEYDDNGNIENVYKYTYEIPKLVFDIKTQLSGHYYEIMYGKNIKRDK